MELKVGENAVSPSILSVELMVLALFVVSEAVEISIARYAFPKY